MPGGLGRGSGKRIYVLDTSAIILGFIAPPGEEQITCKEVLEEAVYGGATVFRVTAAEEGAGPRIIEPEKRYLEKVKVRAEEEGEPELSEADAKLLALALEALEKGWRPVIVSADYSVQNLASILGIEVKPILHRGIRRQVRWVAYCPSCGWRGGVFRGGDCPRCGAKLKRRPSA